MTEEKGLILMETDFYNITDMPTFCERVNNHWSLVDKIPSEKIEIPISDHKEYEDKIRPPKIVITIPAFNEEKTIGKVVKNIISVMNNSNYSNNFLVLVVNDGSTDNTWVKALEAGAYVFSHETNQGLAETFRTEMKICLNLCADIIVHTDADGQYKAEEIEKLIVEVEKGNDLVLGSRFLGNIEEMSLIKRFGNRAFSLVLSGLTFRKISDFQTGFRAFNLKVARNLKIISTHTYTQEQIIRASKKKFKIKEVPIFFAKRDDGESRLMKNPIEYAIKAWVNILKIYLN